MTEDGTGITGGCLCGAVRYRVPGPPLWVLHCHCGSCRRAAGAPFVTWAGFPRGSVDWPVVAPKIHASSPGVSRGFCPTCGSALSYESDRWADETHLAVATFDDPEAVAPVCHVNWREHLSWIELADGLPRRDGNDGET